MFKKTADLVTGGTPYRGTMKRGWGRVVGVGGGSVEHTIKTKVGCFSHNNLGLKGGQEKFYNLSITAIIV